MLIFLLFVMAFLYSFQSLFTRIYAANYAGPDKTESTAVFSVCYGLFIAFTSLAANGFSFRPSWQTWLFGLLNAAVLFLYNNSMIEAGSRGSYAFMMIFCMYGGILGPALVGTVFLDEQLTGLQIFAVILMLASLVVMNLKGISFKGNTGAYYIWCILLFIANGLYGVIMTLQAEVMRGAERAEMLTILFALSAVTAAAVEIARKRGKKLAEGFHMGKRAALSLLVCGISATAAVNLLMYILPQMESSILYTINNGSGLVLSILYSLILFHERPRKDQIVGMVMAVASIVLIEI